MRLESDYHSLPPVAGRPGRRVGLGLTVLALGGACLLILRPVRLAGDANPRRVPLLVEGLDGADLVDLVQTSPSAHDHNRLEHKLSLMGYVPFEQEELVHGQPVSAVEPPVGVVVEITDELDQAITGFGGAFTEAAALVFKSLSAELQDQFLDNYFGSDGIGYTIGRTHINSCDFSPNSWSLDDVPEDFDLKYFDRNATHDQEAMLPLIKAAQAKVAEQGSELKLFASPWSPPAWMKRSGKMDGSTRPGLRDDCKLVWARYIAEWISVYKAQGVPVWGITPQNEPENPARWEACLWSADEEADWVGAYLGPVIKAAHPEVSIFGFDSNKGHLNAWAKTLYSHPTASSYISGIAFHWYGAGSGDPDAGFANVEMVHAEFPQAVLLPSEATYEQYRRPPGTTVETGAVSMGEGYAHEILWNLNVGATGWTDWNLILDQDGGPNHAGNLCDAPMMANVSKQEVYIHPQFYYTGHFSKYIKRGSRRMVTKVLGSKGYKGPPRPHGTCSGDDGLQATAFLLPGGDRFALVALNCGDEAIDFTFLLKGRAVRSAIPAHGIQTYTGFVPVVSQTHGKADRDVQGGHARESV